MRYTKAILLVSLSFGVIAPSRVIGSPVTWEFTGQLTSVRDVDGSLEGVFNVGMPFSGEYTFESTTPDSFPDAPDRGLYEGAVTSVSGAVGNVPFFELPTFTGRIRVSDTLGADGYRVDAATEFLGAPVSFSLSLGDSTGNVFSDDSLPLAPPQFNAFDSSSFVVELEPDGDALIGELTALVPDPGTLLLMVVSVLFVIRRKK